MFPPLNNVSPALQRLVLALALLTSSATLTGSASAGNTSGVPIPAPPAFNKADAAAYGKQLAYYADDFDRGWVDQYSKSRMTLTDPSGDKVTREVRQQTLEGKSGDKSLSRFMSPADIRGVAALIHEHPGGTDDSWLYLPSSRRVRRISGANRTSSFQGTEFTYEDLSGFDPRRYGWRFLGDATTNGQKVAKLEAKPKYKDTGYSKLVLHLNTQHWRSEKIEYYDLAGRHLKTLTFGAWQHHHGRYWRAHRLDMQNHQTRKATTLDIQLMLVNLSLHKRKDGTPRSNLTDDHFTKRALEKG